MKPPFPQGLELFYTSQYNVYRMTERENSFGIIPVIIIVANEDAANIYPVSDLVTNYKNNKNKYDRSKVALEAYLLSRHRKEARNPDGWNDNKNWEDGEKLVAIQEALSRLHNPL